MKRRLFIVGVSIALSNSAIAESVFDDTNVTNVEKNVREIQGGYVVHTQPSGDSLTSFLTPLQTETTVTSGIQSDVLSKKALEIYNTYIVPNSYGLPKYFSKLLIAIIVDRNPMCDPKFDEGNGKHSYGHGLALITEATGNANGITKEQLYDPNTNVQLALKILSSLKANYGDDVNKIVNHYINGDPNVTDPRSQKVLLLLQQLLQQLM